MLPQQPGSAVFDPDAATNLDYNISRGFFLKFQIISKSTSTIMYGADFNYLNKKLSESKKII